MRTEADGSTWISAFRIWAKKTTTGCPTVAWDNTQSIGWGHRISGHLLCGHRKHSLDPASLRGPASVLPSPGGLSLPCSEGEPGHCKFPWITALLILLPGKLYVVSHGHKLLLYHWVCPEGSRFVCVLAPLLLFLSHRNQHWEDSGYLLKDLLNFSKMLQQPIVDT